jgi:hypothetical protein
VIVSGLRPDIKTIVSQHQQLQVNNIVKWGRVAERNPAETNSTNIELIKSVNEMKEAFTMLMSAKVSPMSPAPPVEGERRARSLPHVTLEGLHVIFLKKDKTAMLCVDMRKINGLTQNDVYLLPRIEACLDSLSGAQYFSS